MCVMLTQSCAQMKALELRKPIGGELLHALFRIIARDETLGILPQEVCV